MSTPDAVRKLISKGAVDKSEPPLRYSYRERFGELLVAENYKSSV